MSVALSVEELSHAFEGRPVVREVSLAVAAGEIVCLLGPSGCGKTTTLRLVAGLESVQAGRIAIHGEAVADARFSLAPEKRGVGLVFQDFALFPHLSVAENVAFGLHGAAPERRGRAVAMLERIGLGAFADAYPHMLSGGEQQRVALARALAPGPKLMLMDEPFSGLDVRLRDHVRDTTLSLLAEAGTGTLMVTHDPEEAMRVGDRIAVMQEGRLIQIGSAEDLYDRPVSPFVARFFGETNAFTGRAAAGGVPTPWGMVALPPGIEPDTPVEVLVRPEGIAVDAKASGISALVLESRPLGPATLLRLSLPGLAAPWLARLPRHRSFAPGTSVSVRINPADTFVFPAGAVHLRP
ncbi:ABC transporter ATP-binding protein [Desertibaculum subflavum]|uniref:ABC transporter ATP-binding protein n=1 Tax=Desertibaculum subflavum TaxID=2268458 RepID=UPI000E667D5F